MLFLVARIYIVAELKYAFGGGDARTDCALDWSMLHSRYGLSTKRRVRIFLPDS